MPKIKDLGIKVIPETMRPPEMGPGGAPAACFPTGCLNHTCFNHTCFECTLNITICIGCTHQQFTNFCFCTIHPATCGCTLQHCTAIPTCGCSVLHCSGHITVTCIGCTLGICSAVSPCLCTHIASIPCLGGTGCGAASPVCGGSIIDPGGPITREGIGALKDQLKQQLEALEAHEKTLGPKTAEAIDARQKQLEEELAQLKQRRKELDKK